MIVLHSASLGLALVILAASACATSAGSDDDVADESSQAGDALSGGVAVGAELVTTARVNLRTGPSTTASIVRVLDAGTQVVAVHQPLPSGSFYNVRAGAEEGWVHGSYLAPRGASPASPVASAPGRGFPVAGPWVSFYGPAQGLDIAKIARTFRIINLDADPAAGNVTDAQILALKGNGQNRVISYLNVGSCETYRSYWPSCVATGALTTPYDGYPDEKWADLSKPAYQDLIVDQVAARLAARQVDGFFLDNLEVVEHGAGSTNGPCGAACAQGGLDLVWKLRQKFPTLLIVMQNATGAFTRNGSTHGVSYRTLLDGISHEEVYSNGGDAKARQEMLAWKALALSVAQRPFWLAVEDYAGQCSTAKKSAAQALRNRATADGLSSYVTDESSKQQTPCYWSDL